MKREFAYWEQWKGAIHGAFTFTSRAPAGTGVVVTRPPGHRTRTPVGVCGDARTGTTLSCDP
jgi:hypothetical protein